MAMSALAVLAPMRAALAQPQADQVLTDLGLSADDRQKVLTGQFVTAELPTLSERDLSIAIAFAVKPSAADLSKQIAAGELFSADTQIKQHGNLTASSTAADLAGLRIDDDAAQALAGASAGSSINLATDEIAAFNALKGAGTPAIQKQLQQMLFARFQAYKSAGLAGIAPYDRGGSTSDPAADLRRAAAATAGLKKYLPTFYKALTDYPQASAPGMSETFHWINYDIDGKPTYVLTHRIIMPDGDARIIAQRQFYVSTGYNAGQAVTGFMPVSEGTVVIYANHTFTDQVAGFGGSMKRNIGRGMMEKQLEQIFRRAEAIVK
jgi:hypothetical protein